MIKTTEVVTTTYNGKYCSGDFSRLYCLVATTKVVTTAYNQLLHVPRAVRVESVSHPIPQQVDAKDGKDDEQAGEDPHPPGASLDE